MSNKITPYQSQHKIRFVTAASLFDGHDVAINIMRRILQATGVEVIHLGHNRSVHEVVNAALQEDVHGIAISSYQGGHNEYFKYAIDMLRKHNAEKIKVFGGGGGVITPEEIKTLEAYGVERIYSPQDGQTMGLQGIINDMVQRCDHNITATVNDINVTSMRELTNLISNLENQTLSSQLCAQINAQADTDISKKAPILGITGTGGSGKSSLTDELILRFRRDNPNINIAILAMDPTKRKTGGALLGDRIRMNSIDSPNIFMRSLATRTAGHDVIPHLQEMIHACQLANYDLIIVETPGIGQGDAGIVPFVDTSLYVMTPEYGAASQLEKIDMLDYADVVAINKFDRKGAQDALHDVAKQMLRNQQAFSKSPQDMLCYGTIASRFNDDGVTALYQAILQLFRDRDKGEWPSQQAILKEKMSTHHTSIIPTTKQNYLAEIASTIRMYHQDTEAQATIAREYQQLQATEKMLAKIADPDPNLATLIKQRKEQLTPHNRALLADWPKLQKTFSADKFIFKVRDKEVQRDLYTTSLSGSRIPKVALPKYQDDGERLKWLLKENVAGYFPFTAGVFPLKRTGEDPGRMFAGEGDPYRTNRRFKYLSEHAPANRLSTAFDSVTLYGFEPDERPDIYGKVGNSGVSIASLDDMKVLYDGFDLCDPKTSVSMTINGPAPAILAMFFNTAIAQQITKFQQDNDRQPNDAELAEITVYTLQHVRGTVQADILKEDQAQNTCIFSTEFALKMMADIQEYFIEHHVRNFYSVSISGYHIAEAGANPITQLALTLSNGFTYVETYLARGLHIDDFAKNLSFFFSNAMDPEYSVMGRVARRIWAIAMRDKYGANKRSQKLKYHIQTSGRSLHAQEMAFNDIRTTLEALIAIYDNCNSLHTNAYDEAITTPTEESVRRAQAIQLIINKEWGLAKNENPLQGSFIIDELTDLVEEAVLKEFDNISQRGGVLGAMETGYQRSKIQDESMYYEAQKHDGSLPIIGVNTFVNPAEAQMEQIVELARSTEEEKQSQLKRLHDFQKRHKDDCDTMLKKLQQIAINNENIFAGLMEAVKVCSLGQITQALFEVGGKYRRNM